MPNKLKMVPGKSQSEITIRKLEILGDKLPIMNVSAFLLAITFAYFYRHTAASAVLFLWLFANTVLTLFRALVVYPRYKKATITDANAVVWLNLLTLSLFLNGLIWAIALPYFYVPNEPTLLLVLMFCLFTMMSGGTLTISAHPIGFIASTVPVIVSSSYLFLTSSGFDREFGVLFVLFISVLLVFFFATSRDVTELISLQIEKASLFEQLEAKHEILEENRALAEQAVDEKNRFLAAASHDLRQPLHATGLLLSALEKYIDNDSGKALLNDITQSNQALSDSFSSLLDMSKLDAGVVEVNRIHANLADSISTLEKEFYGVANKKKLDLSFVGDDHTVFTDITLLNRILRNLISNAVRYTQVGFIKLTWYAQDNGYIRLTISDSGIGIADDEIKNIFSEYYQVNNPELGHEDGFGLGLAIVRRLCELLDLKISVKSVLNTGTTFTLDIPAGDPTFALNQEQKVNRFDDLKGTIILVIDDDASVLKSMDSLLTSWGCKTYCVESEEQAIAIFADGAQVPQLVFSDFSLKNNRTGLQVCERLFEELNIELPTVIITGETSPTKLQDVLVSGYQLMHKPVQPAELRAAIHKNLLRA